MENIAKVLWNVKKGKKNYKTATEVSRKIDIWPSTCRDIFKYLHKNFIGIEFKDLKKVYARIYGNKNKTEISVITKPLKWNKMLENKIYDFIESPTVKKLLAVKKKALRAFSGLKANFGKFPRGIKGIFSSWLRRISPQRKKEIKDMVYAYGFG